MTRMRILAAFLCSTPLWLAAASSGAASNVVTFEASGYTTYGDWNVQARVIPAAWKPGAALGVTANLTITDSHLALLDRAGIKVSSLCMLVTAERTFDADGWFRQGSDERMSTLLTPAGLPIEGGVQGAVTNRYGYGFRTPVDVYVVRSLESAEVEAGEYRVRFIARPKLPSDLPPGVYRIRLDFGVVAGTRRYSLDGASFAARPFFQGIPVESHVYSPPIRASGRHVSGRDVDASLIEPRMPWVLLANYNSNGCRGVVAQEDQGRFGISGRNLIQDDIILPLYSGTTRLSYSLEPLFPTDIIEERTNIPWDYSSGELSIQVTNPDGTTTDLGSAPFVARAAAGAPTTKKPAFTSWKPPAYGPYTVVAAGWIADIWGNRYNGGGTYRFWIANRMTLATATFQGMSYPAGAKYGRDIAFAPALPADVEVKAVLLVNSDPNDRREISYSGRASAGGVFGAAQGLKQLTLEAPGEYYAHILARYTDQRGALWVSSMRHAGIVYPEDSAVVARGKKVLVNGKAQDRGETNFEGWVDTEANVNHLAHLGFPYQSGDVLLIASEGQGANKIEPVLTWETKATPAPWDSRLNGVGTSNLQLKTSNGLSPHMFPEYITDWAYYYGAAPRPGFMSRFVVGEDGVRAPYWPTSPNSFGGQINASSNGDMPGDIYRLIGGVAVRRQGQTPLYAGYLSSGFILPKGSNNNRVVAAGSEELIGSTGEKARFFLVGLRPGMLYETGATFAPAVQIDPILPANVSFTLDYPDGRQMIASGTGDKFGSFAGTTRWPLDVPGVYRYHLTAEWQRFPGGMPGLPPSGGEFYVIEKDRPAGAAGLSLNLAPESSFRADSLLTINGTSTGGSVYYAAVIPGSVIDQGTLTVSGGKFQYVFDPKLIHQKTPTYDVAYRVTGAPEIKEVVHLSFFSKEVTPKGVEYHSFARVIIRGTQALYAK